MSPEMVIGGGDGEQAGGMGCVVTVFIFFVKNQDVMRWFRCDVYFS